MMNSDTLFSPLVDAQYTGTRPDEIAALTDDSRKVSNGACYIAINGTLFNGHTAIPAAITAGAVTIVAECPPTPEAEAAGVYWVQVPDTRRACGLLMSMWHGNPSHDLVVLGVTGTNGKTTVSYLCNHIMRAAWKRAGLIGTIVYDNGQRRQKSHHTTPASSDLQEMMADMLRNGCHAVSMEVSSHALHQQRTAGTQFSVGIFTNLTQDHLDYHGSMEEYYQAKKSFFTSMAESGAKRAMALINIDDEYGRRLAEELSPLMRVRTFGLAKEADMRAIPGILSLKGTQFELQYQGKSYLVRTPLIGAFNVSNSLAAIAGCMGAGISLRDAIACLAQAPQVPGRIELVSSVNNVQCFVDYAHTPDAVEKVCRSMKDLCRTGRLITVFGCGGDRDVTKRPLMGAAAAEYSDICIVTSDNPRSEDPELIISQIMQGFDSSKSLREIDRAEAIKLALQTARSGDAVLIAGKGHEDYQIFATETLPFSDAGTVKQYYRDLNPDGLSVPSKKPRKFEDRPRTPRPPRPEQGDEPTVTL